MRKEAAPLGAVFHGRLGHGRRAGAPTLPSVLCLQGRMGAGPTLAANVTHRSLELRMSPLMMRYFTLVGIALAAASMQSRARADTVAQPLAQAACSAAHAART